MTEEQYLKPFLREGEVAILLDISKSNLQKRRLKQLPPEHVKIGRNVRYKREVIQQYIDKGLPNATA